MRQAMTGCNRPVGTPAPVAAAVVCIADEVPMVVSQSVVWCLMDNRIAISVLPFLAVFGVIQCRPGTAERRLRYGYEQSNG